MEKAAGYVDASYLDQVATIVAGTKRRSYELLDLSDGASIADVGCGPASDTLALARIVGPHGRVKGVDHDPEMVAEADRRALAAGLANAEHVVGDAQRLPFGDGELDAVRAERVLQHLTRPVDALAEMVRVVRPGGRVVVLDTDWASLSMDVDDPACRPLERTIVDILLARFRSAYVARELPRLFGELGLAQRVVEVVAQVVLSPGLLFAAINLDPTLADAVADGRLTSADDARVRKALMGGVFSSVNVVIAAGTRC